MELSDDWSGPTPLTSVLRFEVAADEGTGLETDLRELTDLFDELPGCQRVELGRSTDDPTVWVLLSTWASVGEYRRALSSYEVKLRQPLLGRVVDGPSAFEVLYARSEGVVRNASSARGNLT